MHFLALHVNGKSSQLGLSSNYYRLPMHSYFLFKDFITVFVFIIVFSLFVFYSPNTLGYSVFPFFYNSVLFLVFFVLRHFG